MHEQDTQMSTSSYTVRFELSASLFQSEDGLEEWVRSIRGTILFESASSSIGIAVGRLLGYRIQGGSPDTVLQADSHSSEAEGYASTIFDPRTGDVKPSVIRGVEQATNGLDLLVMHLVEIEPGHRGNGVGLAAACRFLDLFEDGCGYAICKPFPLQYEAGRRKDPAVLARLDTSRFVSDEKAAFRKLTEYWKRLGFHSLGRSGYMVMNLDCRRPTLRELVPDV